MNSKVLEKVRERLKKSGFDGIEVGEKLGGIRLTGELSDYHDIIECGKLAVDKKNSRGVINDIKLKDECEIPMRTPALEDKKYDGRTPDALIIGGGIVGCAIARELSRYDIEVMLLEKEYDVATAQSSRNDGMIHAGIDLKPHSKKVKYNMRGNKLYDTLSVELDVPINKVGQYVMLTSPVQKLIYPFVVLRGKQNGIPIKYLNKKQVAKKIKNPGFNYGAIFCPGAGIVSPYLMAIALAENAVENGAEICLNTAVYDIENDGKAVKSVKTNRGVIYPKVLINAAGVFSDKIAEKAGDRFFTVHPRRGVEAILDKKAIHLTDSVIGRFILKSSSGGNHTKGGGIVRTIDDNVLIGPSALETRERENEATTREEIKEIFDKHKQLVPALSQSDIITYFAGTRAPTYEEDFIVERSLVIKNLVQAAGIQSPGVTAAPAIAEDIAKFTVDILKETEKVSEKDNFVSQRRGIPSVRAMSNEEREQLIKQNPDYGVIICRCEEISKGEILHAVRGALPCDTPDAVKRRVRAGMGRCQGGFCGPVITKIIAEELGKDLTEVNKKGLNGNILYRYTKGTGERQ